MKKSILIGVIGAPHGIKGELRITSFSDDPYRLSHYQPLYDAQGRQFKILSLRLHKAKLIAQIEGVASRDAAQTLTGTELFVDRENLDDDLEEDEFYQSDLLGFSVVILAEKGQETKEIGHVSAFFNFGAGDLVEVSSDRGESWLIPFSRAAVPIIDKQQLVMHIDAHAAGLANPHIQDD